ncbi:MAG TPA: WhiB family transcriptional regulator, partial [Gordonia sp. (in: high G+C Gram-positive bacteria)]|nr:WhiB family transcriptional regulator [Gordonia sp. (in: high G+C Gram-positive bacteria)]
MTIEYVLESCTGADRKPALDLPCQVTAADLWFAEDPRDLEQAKALCA